MKALFTAIRDRDSERVRQLCENHPSAVNEVSGGAPKRDRGQSPLQVAVKTANFEIANWLVDHGADVCFMEADGASPWRMPVLHDAIRAATFSSWTVGNDVDTFAGSFGTLDKLLNAGADVRACDSNGKTAATRFWLDVAQIWGPQLPEGARPTTLDRLHQVCERLVGAGVDFGPEPFAGLRRLQTTTTARAYSPKSRFAVDERVAHPQLGEGRVKRLLPDGKIEVDFPVGCRVLVHGR
jgi:hypothetical protein